MSLAVAAMDDIGREGGGISVSATRRERFDVTIVISSSSKTGPNEKLMGSKEEVVA